MRSSRPVYSTILSVLLTLFTTHLSARAADDDGEDYDVKARVVRISLIKGEVTLKRLGNKDWEPARLNFPLVEGDTLATDRDGRLEIQIDARNFVRVGASSMLRIVTLRDEGVALSVIDGTASVRLTKFDKDHEYFEIDAPQTTLAAEKNGLYRVDVQRSGVVRFTVTGGGRARIYSETSGFALRDGHAAELLSEGADAGDWQLQAAAARDSWDNWVDDRERYLAQRMRYDTQYYDNYVWGAEDLDAYGNWSYANDYGWIWRPSVTVINNYNDWAPYRYGYWTWCQPYGWTWVGYEPWGWAPYHYGRWVYYDNYWAWCPRSEYYRHRSWWRPALVAFHLSIGNNVSWYPLSYHHRDPRARYYRAQDRLTPLRRNEIAGLRRANPAYLRAVTSLPANEFGNDNVRLRPASEQLARRAMNEEPLLGDLPVRPPNAIGARDSNGDRGSQIIVARPARVMPAVALPERSTGATLRKPGVALDDDLRQKRVFGNRDPLPPADVRVNSTTPEARPTGAVTRAPRSVPQPLREPGGEGDAIRANEGSKPERTLRPMPAQRDDVIQRSETDRKPHVRPTDDGDAAPPERRSSPVKPSGVDKSVDRSAKPDTERPERVYRPAPVERPMERDRNERPERIERPERRESPPPPAHTYEPPPARSEPAPRNEPRSEPPARSAPAPQKSEPSNKETARPSHPKEADPE
ncbi:MAG: DUF6600 domain-containing protein [bacterium]